MRRVLFVAALLLVAGCHKEEPLSPIERVTRTLTEEFAGSYPAAAPKETGVREYDLVAEPAVVPLFEGRPLNVWAYNRQVPGPILRVKIGERLRVHFTNRLPIDTTVHWHGVRLPNAMDGSPGVTQPPVHPGESFVYEFVAKDAGTFWFHPHLRSSEQVERGLFGVLIVEEPTPPPYSQDAVWVIDDWRLGADGQIDPRFNTVGDLMHDGRWGNVVTVNGHLAEVLEVRPGARLRLRLVNTANGRVFAPDFSALNAAVIAVDEMYTSRPLSPAGFELAPGNRLDLDIKIPTTWTGREIPIIDQFTRRPFRIATIRVTGEVVATPEFPSPAAAHVPQWQAADTVPLSETFALNAQRGGPYGIAWTLNGAVYSDHAAHSALHVPLGRFARFRFANESYRLHPMHIHGLFFRVISRNGLPVDEPFWRDTALVHPKETIDVGFVPVDPGRWMLHCHILEHAESGMMTTLEVGDS